MVEGLVVSNGLQDGRHVHRRAGRQQQSHELDGLPASLSSSAYKKEEDQSGHVNIKVVAVIIGRRDCMT